MAWFTNTGLNIVVGDALVRYINQGITIGSVNMPEVNLRSLTLDEPNHARVRLLHCYSYCYFHFMFLCCYVASTAASTVVSTSFSTFTLS